MIMFIVNFLSCNYHVEDNLVINCKSYSMIFSEIKNFEQSKLCRVWPCHRSCIIVIIVYFLMVLLV